ncbi:MAG: glycosyltransferase family 1 protein [Patescibacteria group bacterium]
MKLILVDGNEANVKNTVGVSVYTLKLLHEFKKYASNDVRFCVYLKKPPLLHLPKENQYFRYRVVWGPAFWLRVFLPIRIYIDEKWQNFRKFLRLSTIDIYAYFAPAHYSPQYLPKKCKLVVTIHDLAYIFFPNEYLKKDRYKLEKWTADSIGRASKIIAVSEHTKKDIVEIFKLNEDQVKTILNGFTPQEKIQDNKQVMLIQGIDYGLEPHNYILYVGTLQPRKNISNLLYAFAMLYKEHQDLRLVIAGKKGWMYDEIFSLAKKLKIDHVVHFLGYVTERDKAYLLNKALCLAFPSLYEGFGLPILEAFSAGCPVVCSNTSSMPEVAGDAALYFDPKNPNDILDKLRSVEANLPLRHSLIEAGEKRVMNFSWETCAKKTIETILS